jgi:F420-non-reducing hydrogenase iron-sulfur subunit
VEPERLEMFNMGASDATKFTAAVEEMTARARELGPNPLRTGERAGKEEEQ